MILSDSLVTRQAGRVSTLFSLSKDAVLLSLATNNTQERLAGPLVDRLGENLGWKDWVTGKKLLLALASYPGSGGSEYC